MKKRLKNSKKLLTFDLMFGIISKLTREQHAEWSVKKYFKKYLTKTS